MNIKIQNVDWRFQLVQNSNIIIMNKVRTLSLCFDVNSFGWKGNFNLEYTHGN